MAIEMPCSLVSTNIIYKILNLKILSLQSKTRLQLGQAWQVQSTHPNPRHTYFHIHVYY